MAEALLPLIVGNYFEVYSAGTSPVGLNPGAVVAMREVGVDIAGHRSKHVNEFFGQQFDYVITVCDRAKKRVLFFPQRRVYSTGVLRTQRQRRKRNEKTFSAVFEMKLRTGFVSFAFRKPSSPLRP
jgi:protein-tyrosine-phosphatase